MRKLVLMPFFVACAGGGGEEVPVDLTDRALPEAGISLIPDAGWPEQEDDGEMAREAAVRGTVDAVAQVGSDDAWNLHLVDEETSEGWTVQIRSPGRAPTVEVGEVVDAEFSSVFGEFGPSSSRGEVRDGAGERLFWWGADGALSELSPPSGIVLTLGESAGIGEDGCGEWEGFDLEATVDGESASVAYAGQAEVGAVLVTNAGLRSEVQETECMDYYSGRAAVLLAW